MRVAFALALLPVAACVQNVELLAGLDAGSAPGDFAGSDGDAPPDATALGDRPALSCIGLGAPVMLNRGGAPICAGALSAELGRFALCTCASLTVGNLLSSDSFDSANPNGGSDHFAAAVGTNGGLLTTDNLTLGGALYVGGADGAMLSAHLETRESLRVAGPLDQRSSDAMLFTDAFVNGAVSGQVKVLGTLHLPQGAMVANSVVAAATVREGVDVAPPCRACDPLAFADLARAVADQGGQNDDDAIGLTADRLAGGGAPSVLDLPCGRFFVASIAASGELELRVHGRAALAVMGDVVLQNRLVVTLDDGAELDLIVGGNFTARGGYSIGNKNAAARIRIWIAGDLVVLEQRPQLGAVLHAPRAQIAAPDGLDLFGSLDGRSFSSGASSTLHFDRAGLAAGVACGAAAQAAIQ